MVCLCNLSMCSARISSSTPNWARAVSAMVRQATGAGVPICVPRIGKRRQPLLVQPGRPVEVGPADANPSDDRVRDIFRSYCIELLRLFDEHKDTALPADVAARGLQLIWRGHESEDFLTEQNATEVMKPNLALTPSENRLTCAGSMPAMRKSRL